MEKDPKPKPQKGMEIIEIKARLTASKVLHKPIPYFIDPWLKRVALVAEIVGAIGLFSSDSRQTFPQINIVVQMNVTNNYQTVVELQNAINFNIPDTTLRK